MAMPWAELIPPCITVRFLTLIQLTLYLTFIATFSVYGHSLTPCVLSDARGNTSVVMVSMTTHQSLHNSLTTTEHR